MKPKAVIWLNHWKYNNYHLVKINSKPDNKLIERLKQLSFLRYSFQYKCFYFVYSDDCISRFEKEMSNYAYIGNNYNETFEKFNKIVPDVTQKSGSETVNKITVSLFPVTLENKTCIKLIFKYNIQIHRIIGKSRIASWSDTYKCWILPDNENEILTLFNLLEPIANIKVNNESEINGIRIKKWIWEQNLRTTQNFRSCPDEYLDKMKLKNYSEKTILNYHFAFLRFINTYRSRTINEINEFDGTIINKYHILLQQKYGKSASTINISVNAIKFYYEEVLQKIIATEPVLRPKKGKYLPNVLSEDDVRKILVHTENLKHKAILLLIYSAGLRVSELINLKIIDIQTERQALFIKGAKGNKDRYTLLSDKALEVLREYYKKYRPSQYLFEGQYGSRFSRTSISNILKNTKEKVGIKQKATIHTLRHSFATHLLEHGTDLRYIQELMGHNSSKTTEIYTHVSKREISKIKSPADNLNL